MTRKLPLGTVFGALAAFAFAAPAVALPITYSLDGTGSGQLGGTPFNGTVDITLSGDTGNVSPFPGAPEVLVNTGSATVTVNGATDAILSSTMQVFVDKGTNPANPDAGFALNANDIWNISNSAFTTFGLNTSFGPVMGPSAIEGTVLQTTGGNFSLTSMGAGTFTSTVVPLPAALPLFGTGLGALGLLGWRRKRRALAVA